MMSVREAEFRGQSPSGDQLSNRRENRYVSSLERTFPSQLNHGALLLKPCARCHALRCSRYRNRKSIGAGAIATCVDASNDTGCINPSRYTVTATTRSAKNASDVPPSGITPSQRRLARQASVSVVRVIVMPSVVLLVTCLSDRAGMVRDGDHIPAGRWLGSHRIACRCMGEHEPVGPGGAWCHHDIQRERPSRRDRLQPSHMSRNGELRG